MRSSPWVLAEWHDSLLRLGREIRASHLAGNGDEATSTFDSSSVDAVPSGMMEDRYFLSEPRLRWSNGKLQFAALVHLADGSRREQCDAYAGISQAHEGLGDLAGALGALKKVRTLEAALTDQEARSSAERRDITLSLKKFSDQWEKLAKEDSLTSLPNRRALEQWLQSALSRARPDQPVTLLMIDVDHFKRVNDRFGHAIGDRTLHTLADLIRQNCRYADFPARYGGEEFILALPQTGLVMGADVAQRLNHSVSAYHWAGIHEDLAVTVSIGVASTAERREPIAAETLIEAADTRLYAAKNSGRNRVMSGQC